MIPGVGASWVAVTPVTACVKVSPSVIGVEPLVPVTVAVDAGWLSSVALAPVTDCVTVSVVVNFLIVTAPATV